MGNYFGKGQPIELDVTSSSCQAVNSNDLLSAKNISEADLEELIYNHRESQDKIMNRKCIQVVFFFLDEVLKESRIKKKKKYKKR